MSVRLFERFNGANDGCDVLAEQKQKNVDPSNFNAKVIEQLEESTWAETATDRLEGTVDIRAGAIGIVVDNNQPFGTLEQNS